MSKSDRRTRFKLPEFVLALLLIFSGTMLAFSSGGFVINFKQVGFSVLSSLQKASGAVVKVVTGTFTAFRDMANLQKEYAALTEKLKDYEYLQRNNTEIRKENERLKEQLDFQKSVSYNSISCRIIARDPDAMYSGITLDKGARSGVKKGMSVIAVQKGNVGIVGRVVSVGLTTCMIMPLYDPKFNISSRIQNTRDIGIISGSGSQDIPLEMKYIRRRVSEDLHLGDIVVTSGENGNYIRDIPVGRISNIEILDYDSSLKIEIDPVIDFSRLEIVMLVDSEAK